MGVVRRGSLVRAVVGLVTGACLIAPSFAAAQDGEEPPPPPPPDPALAISSIEPAVWFAGFPTDLVVRVAMTSPGDGSLVVRLLANDAACPAGPTSGTAVGNHPVSQGSDTVTFAAGGFIPASAAERRVCVYLRDESNSVLLRRDQLWTVAAPVLSSVREVSGVLTDGGPAEVTIWSQGPDEDRRAWAFVRGSRTGFPAACGSATQEHARSTQVIATPQPKPVLAELARFTIPGIFNIVCTYAGDSLSNASLVGSHSFFAIDPTIGDLRLSPAETRITTGEKATLSVQLVQAQVPRQLFVTAQLNGNGCAATAGAQMAQQRTTTLVRARPIAGGETTSAELTPSADGNWLVCAYVAAGPDLTPDSGPVHAWVVASAPPAPPVVAPPVVTPPVVTPPAGTPTRPLPSGVGGPLDVDPGRISDEIGDLGKGSFWVNNTVMPQGISAERFVEIARRSGRRWGYTFRGVTTRGAAKRDGRRVIGFSSSVTTKQLGRIIRFRKRAKRPAWCGKLRSGACRIRYITTEREIALARRLTTWWDGADHPPADRHDVESALLRLFGMLAGNPAEDPACSGTPLLRPTGVTAGWWWRSPEDYFRPRCPGNPS